MGLKQHKRKLISLLDHTHWLTRPVKGLCGTQGYVINRIGMQKVIKTGASISEPIDKFFDHFWDIPLQCFCVEPHLIWERPRIKTSVKKQSRGDACKPLKNRIRKHQIKLTRSFRRKLYMLTQISRFFPSQKSFKKTGKTTRIH
jgi:glycosyl transferase family 25